MGLIPDDDNFDEGEPDSTTVAMMVVIVVLVVLVAFKVGC